jgi:hypothetical protein
MTSRILVLALIIAALTTTSVLAQVAVVSQPVNLRADPSTENPPLRLRYPPERFQLIPPKASGDVSPVSTGRNEVGGAWTRHVSVDNRDDWMRGGHGWMLMAIARPPGMPRETGLAAHTPRHRACA